MEGKRLEPDRANCADAQHVTLSGAGIVGLTTSKTSLAYGSVRFWPYRRRGVQCYESSNEASDAERNLQRDELSGLLDHGRRLRPGSGDEYSLH